MPRSQKQKRCIGNDIEKEVKKKLWDALVASKKGSLRSLENKFEKFVKENRSLRAFLLKLKEKFIGSKRTNLELKNSLDEYFGKFGEVLFEYLAEISEIAATRNGADLDDAFASLTLTKAEQSNAVKHVKAETAKSAYAYSIPQNTQVYTSQARLLRRMDSLARLLSISTSASVCTAVTIYDGELYIASNVSGEISQDEMVDRFTNKLLLIRNFIQEVQEKNLLLTDPNLQNLIQGCVYLLNKEGGSLGNQSLLMQALFKFVHAVSARNCRDEDISGNFFSSDEVNAILLLKHVTVLLPYGKIKRTKKSTEKNRMGVHIIDESGKKIEQYDFPERFQDISVKDFHAEQLIVKYLKDKKSVKLDDKSAEKIRIGLTKLCCRTCFTALSNFPRLELRGTHSVSYSNVADLFSGTVCGQVNTPNNRNTAAKRSPGDTPLHDMYSSLEKSPHNLNLNEKTQLCQDGPSNPRKKAKKESYIAAPLDLSGDNSSEEVNNETHRASDNKSSGEPNRVSHRSYRDALKNNRGAETGPLDIKTNKVASSKKFLKTKLPHPMRSPNGVDGAVTFFSPEKSNGNSCFKIPDYGLRTPQKGLSGGGR